MLWNVDVQSVTHRSGFTIAFHRQCVRGRPLNTHVHRSVPDHTRAIHVNLLGALDVPMQRGLSAGSWPALGSLNHDGILVRRKTLYVPRTHESSRTCWLCRRAIRWRRDL